MTLVRRTFIQGAASAIALPAWAQRDPAADYPNRPIKLICPFAPGGGVDLTARTLAQRLNESWGQPVVVDNKAGANGTIAVEAVAKSPADGYMLTMISSSHSVNVTLQSRHPYDLEKDVIPITQATTQPYCLVVNPALPVRTLQDLVNLARQKPDILTYGSSGIGGFSHLAGALFGSVTGTRLMHIPYKGGAPAMADVISGQISMLFSTILQSHTHINSGKLRPLAVTTARRANAMPEIPTMLELGVKVEMAGWYGVMAPKGTPAPIVDKLNREISRILKVPTTRERLAADGSEPVGNTLAEFGAHIGSEIRRWRALINELGIKGE
jgi:tripartite-type tricarboxylate transporter receptor subunit TctC